MRCERDLKVNSTVRGNELIITKVVTEDSGIYTCHELQKFSRKVIFHLAVEGRDTRLVVLFTDSLCVQSVVLRDCMNVHFVGLFCYIFGKL